MDVDFDENGTEPVPVSPIVFKDKLPDSIQIVPVVFIVNEVLKTRTKLQLQDLAKHISAFVNAKVQQAGKHDYQELQIDCDWTTSTREKYFYLLNQLEAQPILKGKQFSATLRLHQLKNQKGSGIPPVNSVMLMCYNMGNLRAYGPQNSILQLSELRKYLGNNAKHYSLPFAVGLPLFEWAVAFRDQQYIGISKKIKIGDLNDKNQFNFRGNNIYRAITDLTPYGLHKDDEIRWETVPVADLQAAAKYLSTYINTDTLDIIYYHLDETSLKKYSYEDLEGVNRFLH